MPKEVKITKKERKEAITVIRVFCVFFGVSVDLDLIEKMTNKELEQTVNFMNGLTKEAPDAFINAIMSLPVSKEKPEESIVALD